MIFADHHGGKERPTFSRSHYLDPSKRVAEKGSRLFEPFYLLDTVDMNTDFKQVPTLEESEDPQHFFRFGRPLWGALLSPSSEAEGFKPERVIELAIDKLIGGKSFIRIEHPTPHPPIKNRVNTKNSTKSHYKKNKKH